jgi:hypothetical protein
LNITLNVTHNSITLRYIEYTSLLQIIKKNENVKIRHICNDCIHTIMFEPIQVLLILKKYLSTDLALMITSFYNVLRQTIKPGQFVFDSPCGHLLQYIFRYKSKKFLCPINNENYTFDKEVCGKISSWFHDGKKLLRLTETTNLCTGGGIACDRCDRCWDFTCCKTDLEQRIVCVCGKIATKFPCDLCPIKKCCFQNCYHFAHKTSSSSVMCRKHYQCKKCKEPFLYNYDIPNPINVTYRWIMSCCVGCEINKHIDFDWDLFRGLFPDEYNHYVCIN